jgi:ATP-dependent DNA helicase RecQ
LRSYTGLFSEYVSVREEVLAKRAGLTRDMVYQYFVRLSKMNIIKYIPGKRSALIVFTEERLNERSIYISAENYADRKERMEIRLKALEYYAFNNSECRSITLLKYFGQNEANECGHCDYCRNKDKALSSEEFLKIRELIIQKLVVEKLFPETFFNFLKYDTEKISDAIRQMLDNEELIYDEEGRLGLFSKSEN